MTFQSNALEQIIVAAVNDMRQLFLKVPLHVVEGKNYWRIIMDAYRLSLAMERRS